MGDAATMENPVNCETSYQADDPPARAALLTNLASLLIMFPPYV